MKIVATIARYLMGLIFVVFGLNKFLNFIPTGPMPGGVAGQFMNVFIVTKWAMMVGLVRGRGRPFPAGQSLCPSGSCLPGPGDREHPVCERNDDAAGLPATLVVTVCWILVYFRVRSRFAPLFKPTKQE